MFMGFILDSTSAPQHAQARGRPSVAFEDTTWPVRFAFNKIVTNRPLHLSDVGFPCVGQIQP